MKICITRGIYGFRQNGCVVEKTSSSAPFDVDDEEGKRLIVLNVAREVAPGGNRREVSVSMENEEEGFGDCPENVPEDELENMPFSELRQMAKELGVKGSGSREELIERLREHIACTESEEDEELDESEMPELTVEEPE